MNTSVAAAQTASRLALLICECVDTGVARRVLLVRLSGLPRVLARPHHLRLIQDALAPLASASRAQTFHLPSGDIAIVWRGAEEAALARTKRALDCLFEDASVAEPARLLAVMHLPDDAVALRAEIGAGGDAPVPISPFAGRPFDPSGLVRLEQALAQADIARFVRRERIRTIEPGALDSGDSETGGFRLAWERRFLAAEDVAAALTPGVALRTDPWLFARLTRTFDRRMLALLSAPAELHGAGPFSLDLNVASLLGPEFTRFDAALPRLLRGQVTIDLVAPDILADLAAFGFARDFARERGYRLGLRGVGAELAPVLPAGRLGFDFVHLRWAEAWAGLAPDLASMSPAAIVLAGADTAEAVAWGRAQGVTLFQGAAVA